MRLFAAILFLLFVAGTKISFGEDPVPAKVDSLNRLLRGAIADTMKVEVLLELAEESYLSSPSVAVKYCDSALLLSEKIHFDNGIANACGWLAYLYEQEGEINRALASYRKALSISIKNKNKKDEATILNNIAAIYKDQGRIDEALILHRRSLALRKMLGDQEGVATSYNNMGLIYSSQGRTGEALDYYLQALALEEGLNNPNGIASALLNIAAIYKEQREYDKAMEFFYRALQINIKAADKYSIGYALNGLGGLHDELGNSDSALYYFGEALKVRTEIDDKQGIAYTLKNAGIVYKKLGLISDAEMSFRKSLAHFEILGDKWGKAVVYNLLGELLIPKNKREAEEALNKSLQLSQQLGYPLNIRNAAGNLQRLYRENGMYERALKMNDLYIQMNDSVLNDNNRKATLRTQFKYEFERKSAALKSEQEKKDALSRKELQKQKLVRNGFVGGFAIVLLFAGVFFTQRNKIKEGKRRSDELLLNILPEEVAEELKSKGSAVAKQYDEVTVMFTDFKNFTQISEKLTPAELVDEIDTCFKAFDYIVGNRNIEKIKTIGDSYMCAGGLPVANKTHASDVVSAALEIQAFMLQHRQQRLKEGREPFEIRIGIHTGPVVAGIVGVKKFAYDIWGDTVNISSRMESSGEAGKVNISGSTFAMVKDKFDCLHRGKIQAKNKGEIDMYFVESPL